MKRAGGCFIFLPTIFLQSFDHEVGRKHVGGGPSGPVRHRVLAFICALPPNDCITSRERSRGTTAKPDALSRVTAHQSAGCTAPTRML